MDDKKQTALIRNLEKAKSDREKLLLLVMALEDPADMDAAHQYLSLLANRGAS